MPHSDLDKKFSIYISPHKDEWKNSSEIAKILSNLSYYSKSMWGGEN